MRRGVRNRRAALFGGLVLALAASVFMLAALVGELRAPAYDAANNFISDLGVIPETASFFNAALICAGLLVLIGGGALYRAMASVPISLPFLIGGIACALTGAVPLSLSKDIHEIVALVALASLNTIPAATAVLLRGWTRILPITVSLVGLTLLTVLTLRYTGVIETAGWSSIGGLERLTVYPALLWLLVLAGYLVAQGTERHLGP